MANIDDAFRIGTLSLNDNVLITEGSEDPSTGAGFEAPVGSLYLNSVTGSIFRKYGTWNTAWTNFGEVDAAAVFAAVGEPTGFINRADSTLSFDSGTREFRIDVLTPATSYGYYIKGVKHTITTTKSITLPDVTGYYYIFFDGTEQLSYHTTFSDILLQDVSITAIIYWNATTSQAIYFADERHSVGMDGATHSYLHNSIGARYVRGLALGGTLNPYGDNTADIQFSVHDGAIRDEDIVHNIVDVGNEINVYDLQQELSPIAQIPVFYREGYLGEWHIKPADSFAFIYNGTAGYSGTLIPYNQWTGAVWQLTPMTDGYYGLVHILATNDARNPIIAIQGTSQYNVKPAGPDTALKELHGLANLPIAEFVPIATLIFRTSSTITNSQKLVWVKPDSGENYIDWRAINNISLIKSGHNDHGVLTGLLDDDHTQYALAGTGSTRTFDIGDLSNVLDLSHISADDGKGYNLFWNTSTQQYVVGLTSLDSLSDVSISNSAGIDGYGLKYDNATGYWYAAPLAPIYKLYDENPSAPSLPDAAGINSVAIGDGAQTATTAPNSIAVGNQSLARHKGALVHANGRFGTTGDAQQGQYLLRTHTINNVFTEMFLDGTNGSVRLTLPDNATWFYKVTITAHRTDADDGHAGYKVEGVIYRNSGADTTALQGFPVKQVVAESNASWDINISADAVNGTLKIQVKGENAKTIRWLALVETVEITN